MITHYFTEKELEQLEALRSQLHKMVAHSSEAIAIGKAIREVDNKAFKRTYQEPMPKWMKDFSKAQGL